MCPGPANLLLIIGEETPSPTSCNVEPERLLKKEWPNILSVSMLV